MNLTPSFKREKIKQARLEIVSELYKRGHPYSHIAKEVKRRLGVKTCSVSTIFQDVQTLLKEWRAYRIENMDAILQLELERIDSTVAELWQQWEKSKEDHTKTTITRKGKPKKKGAGEDGSAIETDKVEESRSQVFGLGDPAYIIEIRKQLMERRKLLGLYAPEKQTITSEINLHRSPSDMSAEEIKAEMQALGLKVKE